MPTSRVLLASGFQHLATGATLALLLAILPSCSREPTVKLDVSKTEGGRAAALTAKGLLQGEVEDGKACFWVEVEGGSTHSIVWPAGSQARIEPLRVVDRDGTEIAKVGDSNLVFGGSPLPDQPGCHAGSSTWLAGNGVQRGPLP
jgi:hypothetical protein